MAFITRRGFLKGTGAFAVLCGGVAAGGYAFMKSAKFGRLPQGDRLERVLASPNYRNGRFQNLPSSYEPIYGRRDKRGGVLSSIFRKKELRLIPCEGEIAAVKTDFNSLGRERDCFVWFGHSSYFLQVGGARILVDPVFHIASPIPYLMGESFPGTDIFKPADIPDIDILIITHDHWDHLDYETVMALKDRIGALVMPLGVGEHFEFWGFDEDRLHELDWGESLTLSTSRGENVEMFCLPTHHFSGRTFTRNQTLWASFLVKAASKSTYFGGDGGYDERFAKIGAKFPKIDLAFLENGQYNLRWPRVHTLPDELDRAMRELGAASYVTGHHGKFCISTHPWDEPYENEKLAAAKARARLVIPLIGEIVEL